MKNFRRSLLAGTALAILFLLLAGNSAQAQPIAGGCPFNAGPCLTQATGGTTAQTLAARARQTLTVIDEGALGDGSTDDTTAFANCAAAGNICYVPGINKAGTAATYVLNCATLASGSALIGQAPAVYSSGASVYPQLVPKAGAQCVLDPLGSTSVTIRGVYIDCSAHATADGINGGSTLATIENVSETSCRNGLGNGSGTGDQVTHQATIINSIFKSNSSVGVSNLIDSAMFGGSLTGSVTNAFFGSGTGGTNFIGVRNEFAGEWGIKINTNNDSHVQVIGGMFDRNTNGAIFCQPNSGYINISGVDFYRNGPTNTSGNNANIVMDTCSHISIGGVTGKTGVNDGGGGTLSPAYFISFFNTNSDVTVSGDLTGVVTSALIGTLPTNFFVGAADGVAATIPDGTVGAPGLTFSSDATTGLYKVSGGWSLSAAGVQTISSTNSLLTIKLPTIIDEPSGSTAYALLLRNNAVSQTIGLELDSATTGETGILGHVFGDSTKDWLIDFNNGLMTIKGTGSASNTFQIRNKTSTLAFNIDTAQHVQPGNATAPTISSGACGATTNGAVAAGANDQAGQVQIGSATTTACTVSFAGSWVTAPRGCVFSAANAAAAAVTTLPYMSSISTAAFVLTGAVLASTNWYYHCY